jgi:hypothetical protein
MEKCLLCGDEPRRGGLNEQGLCWDCTHDVQWAFIEDDRDSFNDWANDHIDDYISDNENEFDAFCLKYIKEKQEE